jgi:type IX secretion system PorP/SprF family membrane protein
MCCMRNRIITTLLLSALIVVFANKAFAQQTVMYTQYMFNGLVINPAYAGSDKYLNVTLQARQQWMGFKGAPTSQMFSAHNCSANKKNGIGILVERETMGVSETFNGYLMYAYKITFKKSVLSLGLQAGVSNYQQQLTELNTPQGSNDPSFANNVSYTLPNFGAGLYYNSKHFYFGLAVPYLLQNTFDSSNPVLSARQSRNYFLTSGFVFDMGSSLKLKPNFLVRYVSGAPVNVDLNLNLLIKEVLWIGCSYRVKNSINPLIEMLITPKLRIGFTYDIPISAMAGAYSGSPEAMINYRFIKKKKTTRVLSPRYF